jgi:hypothetical protein
MQIPKVVEKEFEGLIYFLFLRTSFSFNKCALPRSIPKKTNGMKIERLISKWTLIVNSELATHPIPSWFYLRKTSISTCVVLCAVQPAAKQHQARRQLGYSCIFLFTL